MQEQICSRSILVIRTVTMVRIIAYVGHTVYYLQCCGVIILLRKCMNSVTHINHTEIILVNTLKSVSISEKRKLRMCMFPHSSREQDAYRLAPYRVLLLSFFCRLSFPRYVNISLAFCMLVAQRDDPVFIGCRIILTWSFSL